MLFIVAHHYVVNSGILQQITPDNVLQSHSIFALLLGWGGKTGINCFVLITGYFMCTSNITVKKFLKLFLEIYFYNILFYIIFLCSGYMTFSVKDFVKTIFPVYGIGTGFSHSYMVFFLFIPYLNILIKNIAEKQYRLLLLLCLSVGTILPTFFYAPSAFTYVGWFMVLYFVAAYIRLYPNKVMMNRKLWAFLTCIMLLVSWLSVLIGAILYHFTGKELYYYFVSDSNKLLAVAMAICAFLLVVNCKIKYCPLINYIAGSTFGVLLIHSNSDTMRNWLWEDVLGNVEAFHSNMFIIHAVVSILGIYIVCTIIDIFRRRFIEAPFFRWYDTKRKVNSYR